MDGSFNRSSLLLFKENKGRYTDTVDVVSKSTPSIIVCSSDLGLLSHHGYSPLRSQIPTLTLEPLVHSGFVPLVDGFVPLVEPNRLSTTLFTLHLLNGRTKKDPTPYPSLS